MFTLVTIVDETLNTHRHSCGLLSAEESQTKVLQCRAGKQLNNGSLQRVKLYGSIGAAEEETYNQLGENPNGDV